MKKSILLIAMVFTLVALIASPVGKIRFLLGEVTYKGTQNQAFVMASINMPVNAEGFIKTGPDATAEVQWNNGSVSIVKANNTVSISKLLAEANTNPNWKSKMKDKISSLQPQNRNATNVAGIRRDEAEVKKESQLYWYVDTPPSLDDAIKSYEAKDFTKAIPIFENVIVYAPLKREAELSHAYLIMIYDEMGDKIKLKKHVELLKADFPNSSTLDSLPPEQ